MDEEHKKSIHVPAFFANRAHLSRLVGSARLAFAEELDGELSYSVAVRMTDMEMTVLRDLLIRAYPLGEKLAE